MDVRGHVDALPALTSSEKEPLLLGQGVGVPHIEHGGEEKNPSP